MNFGEGQGSLVCCSPWGCKESDTTERLNNKHGIRWPLCFHTKQVPISAPSLGAFRPSGPAGGTLPLRQRGCGWEGPGPSEKLPQKWIHSGLVNPPVTCVPSAQGVCCPWGRCARKHLHFPENHPGFGPGISSHAKAISELG